MMIYNTSKCFEDEKELKIDMSRIKKFMKIISVLLIIFTTLYFTCFGCFLLLNDSTSWAAQTVTLSSEGAAYERYPDSMGEYQLTDEEIEVIGGDGSFTVYNWYRHVDREDRFLIYNRTDYRWFITTTNNTENAERPIRSKTSGRIIYPEMDLEYFAIINIPIHIPKCTTVR